GIIMVGVNDKGQVCGVPATSAVPKDIANQIDQNTGVHPSIESLRHGGKTVIKIAIEPSKVKPVMYRGRAYKRVGNTTRQMSLEELTRVILDNAGTTWDELPDPRATMGDIDPTKVRHFVRLANEEGRRPIPRGIPLGTILAKL